MGDAPDKPNPTGLTQLASSILGGQLGSGCPPIAYLGDTVADVITIKQARKKFPDQKFVSFAIAPPHLHSLKAQSKRIIYESNLKKAGADYILNSIHEIIEHVMNW